MNNTNNKCVIIIDEASEKGVAANISAILGISLGKLLPETVGKNIIDKNDNVHNGIIEFPVPVLKTNTERITEIRNLILIEKFTEITVIDFSTLAQSCKTYDEYENKMKLTAADDLSYIGIAICGNKKIINKLTGNLPLLR